MKESKSIVVIACSLLLASTAFAELCPRCHIYVAGNYCRRCGTQKPSLTVVQAKQSESAPVLSENLGPAFGDRLAGFGRGIVTAALAPLNFIRGMMSGGAWAFEAAGCPRNSDGTYSVDRTGPGQEFAIQTYIWFTLPVGTAAGSFCACADLVNGTLDTVTLGYYGDWLYKSINEGEPTPWIWERKWMTPEIPWINR